tara:strand:- start:53 stop:523 length:471 start_codon:yes stop_codon:yes gene_type:complete
MVEQWEVLATVNGDGTSTDILTGTIDAKKFLQLQWFVEDANGVELEFNGDTAANYSRRWSNSWGAENLNTGLSNIGIQYTTTQIHGSAYISNISTEEKLIESRDTERNTAGAGNVPYTFILNAKWTNTSDSITSIRMLKGGSNFTALDNLTVFGTD